MEIHGTSRHQRHFVVNMRRSWHFVACISPTNWDTQTLVTLADLPAAGRDVPGCFDAQTVEHLPEGGGEFVRVHLHGPVQVGCHGLAAGSAAPKRLDVLSAANMHEPSVVRIGWAERLLGQRRAMESLEIWRRPPHRGGHRAIFWTFTWIFTKQPIVLPHVFRRCGETCTPVIQGTQH